MGRGSAYMLAERALTVVQKYVAFRDIATFLYGHCLYALLCGSVDLHS